MVFYVAVGLHFLRVNGGVHVDDREKVVARLDHRGSEQRAALPDRDQDGTVWVCAGQSVLHRSLFV